jgi:hypothetical protein
MSSNTAKPPSNGTILTIVQIIKAVMSLAAEAEVGALYINCREAMLDNTTALGVVNNNAIKKLKAMDTKYHWLHNRECQGQFQHYWAPGKENNGNYMTTNHSAIHHQVTRPTFLTNISTLQALCQQLSLQLTGNLPIPRVC